MWSNMLLLAMLHCSCNLDLEYFYNAFFLKCNICNVVQYCLQYFVLSQTCARAGAAKFS